MEPRGRTRKHVCNKCNKSFASGRSLGGHMSRHWHIVEQPKRTTSPSASVADVHMSLLSPSDKEALLPSPGTQCKMCSKVFSACNSLTEHSEKKVLSKPVEQGAALMEAMAIADGDYNVMLSPTVKRKRSKRETQALNFDVMDAAVTLLLLSEHYKKILAYGDWSAEGMDSLFPNVSKDVKRRAFDHLLVRSAEFKKPIGHKCSTYDDCCGQCKKDNNLFSNVPKYSTLIPNVPKKDDKKRNLIPNVHEEKSTSISRVTKTEVELNVLDHVLAGDAEHRKLRTGSSVQMQCADPSAVVKVKTHQCNACGKLFGSGQALGGHMTLRHPRCNHRRHMSAHYPNSVVMQEKKKKLEWVSKLLDLGVPALTDGYYYTVASLSDPQRRVSSVH